MCVWGERERETRGGGGGGKIMFAEMHGHIMQNQNIMFFFSVFFTADYAVLID